MYDGNKMKPFSFATILPKPIFKDKEVVLENTQFSIVFSVYNYVYGLHLYNAFLNEKLKKFSLNKNSLTLTAIIMIPEKEITGEKIIIKMSSPLVCRNHNKETLKDMYYSCLELNDQEFQKYIRINIKEQLISEKLDTSLLDNFEIIPINTKKAIISNYEKKIETTLGILELHGQTDLLKFLYKEGVGSKRSMGFRVI